MNLGKLQDTVRDGEAWCTAAHGFAKSWTRLRDWTTSSMTIWGWEEDVQSQWKSLLEPSKFMWYQAQMFLCSIYQFWQIRRGLEDRAVQLSRQSRSPLGMSSDNKLLFFGINVDPRSAVWPILVLVLPLFLSFSSIQSFVSVDIPRLLISLTWSWTLGEVKLPSRVSQRFTRIGCPKAILGI